MKTLLQKTRNYLSIRIRTFTTAILIFFSMGFNNLFGQYCATPTTTVTITPTSVSQNTVTYNSGYRAFSFTAGLGCSYTFSTCGLSSQDTYLRLYLFGNSTVLSSSDDYCSTQSQITWVCPATGTYLVLLSNYSCVQLGGNTTMSYILNSCPAYQAQIQSISTGSSTWCAGETRNVSVTIKNTGTATWSTSFPVNIGVKWNTNGAYWNDYHSRVSAANLAPGSTATYTLSITAANATSGPTYTGGNLTAGSNNLTFDVVKEGDCWFGGNGGSCGPGNSVYTSPVQTIVVTPSAAITPVPSNGATGTCYKGTGAVTSVSWAATSGATSYDVYFGAGSLPGTVTSNVSTNSYTTGTLSPSTTYYWKVVPKNSCGSAGSPTTWTFTTAAAPCYCSANGTTGTAGAITYLGFNTISNATPLSCSATTKASGYSDFTGTTTTVTQGANYYLNTRINTDFAYGYYTYYVKAWIDWDQSGVFDAGEAYDLGSAYNVCDGATSVNPYTVTVPSGAVVGNTRMRVMVLYNSSPTNPCATSIDGEVEDYTVVVVAKSTTPACIAATASNSPPSPVCAGGSISLISSGIIPYKEVGNFSGTQGGGSGTANITSVSDNFTMEFWTKPASTLTLVTPASTGITGTSSQCYAIMPYQSGTNAGAGVSVGTNGIQVFEHGNAYLPCLLSYSGTISSTSWTHIAVVYTSKRPSLYINGVLAAVGFASTMVVYPSIGSGGTGGYGPWIGKLDNVRIWDGSLTQSQVQNVMYVDNATVSGRTILARYSFNGGSLADDKGSPAKANWSPLSSSPQQDCYTYTWSGPAPLPSASANETQTTTLPTGGGTINYSVVASKTGCSGTTSNTTSVTEETTAPIISGCPSNISICSTGSTIVSWASPTASDNCSVTSFTSNYVSGATFPIGTTNVIYTAKDGANNQSTCNFTITVNAKPAAPTSGGDKESCYRATVPNLTVTVGAGEVADWYTASSGGSSIKTGLSFNEAVDGSGPNPTPGTYMYYVEARNTTSGCVSATRTGISLVVHSVPVVSPTPAAVTVCPSDAVTLAANATPGIGASSITMYAWSSGLAGSVSGGVVNPTASTTYTVTATNNYNCTNSASAVVDVKSAAAYVILPSSTVTTAVEQCTDGGWTYYANASSPDDWIFAIRKNGNTFTAEVDVTVLGSRASVDNINTAKAGWEHGSYLMTRYWNASVLTGSISTPVDVKFFYDIAEKTAALNARDAAWASYPSTTKTAFRWFKTVGVPFGTTQINAIDGNSFNAFSNITLTESASGTENGVTYAQFDGITSFSGGTGGYGFSSSGTGLPVKLIEFTATAVENSYIRLDWSTALEINNAGFEVERSTNGIEFTKIGWMVGHDNSTTQQVYTFDDKTVLPNTRYYYRLKQVDNGNVAFEYSKIVSAVVLGGKIAEESVVMYPNPANKNLSVVLDQFQGEVMVTVTNVLGEAIYSYTDNFQKNKTTVTVPLEYVSDGYYFVTVRGPFSTITKKIVKASDK